MIPKIFRPFASLAVVVLVGALHVDTSFAQSAQSYDSSLLPWDVSWTNDEIQMQLDQGEQLAQNLTNAIQGNLTG